jgi:hypothetical protein
MSKPGPDQTQPGLDNQLSGYVRSECIGTLGWHLSLRRYGQWLNSRTGFETVLLPSETVP